MRVKKIKRILLLILVLPLFAVTGIINWTWKIKNGEPRAPSFGN